MHIAVPGDIIIHIREDANILIRIYTKIISLRITFNKVYAKKIGIGLSAVLPVLLVLLVCWPNPVSTASEKNKTITFAGNDKFPPYSYLADSSPTGFFVDITKLIASESDLDIRIKLMPWDKCLSGLRTGKIDVLIGAPFDEKSKKFMSFSVPIHELNFSIFVNMDNYHVNSLSSLEGTVVAVRRWSPIVSNVDKHKSIKFVKTGSILEALEKLRNRDVTAIIVERNTALYYISKYRIDDIKMVQGTISTPYKYTFSVKPDNEDLLAILNSGIELIKETDTLEILRRRWLGIPNSRHFPWKIVIVSTALLSGLMLLIAGVLWVIFLNATIKIKTQQIKDMHQKMVEKDKLAVLGKLSGQIAHELRTPLSIIHNSIYLLEAEGAEDKDIFKKRLTVLEDKVKLCSNILESILSYSRIKAEIAAPISLKECMEEVLHDLDLSEKIQTKVTFSDKYLLTVFMDYRQLYSVLRNLMLNSIQAMNNEGKLTISVGPSDNNRTITIRLVDTGPGIAGSVRNKIFNLFYSSNITGTGLGLPISRSIIEANNGQLYLEETSQSGSCFIIKLPSSKNKK